MDLTLDFDFNAALALPGYDGNCGTPHGYDFRLRLTLRVTDLDAARPWIADIAAIEQAVDRHALGRVRDAYLNDVIAYPSLEGIALWFGQRLFPELDKLETVELRAGDRYGVGLNRSEWERICMS